MLQAYTKKGRIIIPALLSRDRLKVIRSSVFYCPECKEKVFLRAGGHSIPHFAHYRDTSCAKGHGESNFHLQGKLQLYDWLRQQHIPVLLEPRIKEINQWPDILIQIEKRRIAIEFQCAKITAQEIIKRNQGYEKANIYPIWILGANRFRRIGQAICKVDSFTSHFLQQFSSNSSVQLLYYCPIHQLFLHISDIYLTNSQQTIGKFTFLKRHNVSLLQLFQSNRLTNEQLYHNWLAEKKSFRLSRATKYGREALFQNWLYQKGIYKERLPGIIYLPNKAQHQMNLPLWQWQTLLIIKIIHPHPVGTIFSLQQFYRPLEPYYVEKNNRLLMATSHNPVFLYLQQLRALGIIRFISNDQIMKERPILFYHQIEEAIKGDRAVLKRLLGG